MPKILILFAGTNHALAELVAEGARTVRFSEIEIRRVGKMGAEPTLTQSHHPVLSGVDEAIPYDAIVLAASSISGDMDPELRALLEDPGSAPPRAAFLNKVGSAVALLTANESQHRVPWPLLARLGELGMIIVPPAGADANAARELGVRVMQVAGWITHARSHHHHAH